MVPSENPYVPDAAVSEGSKQALGAVASRGLRWWPAVVLLVLMPAVKFMPDLFESAPLPLLMVGFMGPGLIAVLLAFWWMFASRAAWSEKLIGAAALVVIGAVTMVFLHPSMQGMSQIFFQVPSGLAAFSLAMVLWRMQPARRLTVSLICAAVAFGVWDLMRLDGTTGKFSAELSPRWSSTPEEEYLRKLAAADAPGAAGSGTPDSLTTGSQAANSAESTETPITRATAEWAEFRGPKRDSHFPGVQLAADWTAQPPVEKWRVLVGPGWSSFSVGGQRLFTQEQRGDLEAVVCLDALNGRVLWAHEYASRFWEAIAGAGPRATPTIGDHGLYTLGANGDLFLLNPSSGELRWHRKLQDDAHRTPPQWGFSSSPLLIDDLVVVHAGGPVDKGVLAFDAKTGEPRWSSPSGDHSYCSPHIATFADVTGILMSTNSGLQFLDAATGTELWKHAWETPNYRATQPLIDGNAVYFGTSLGGGTRRLDVTKENDQWSAKEVWTSQAMKPDFNDFVAIDGYLYGFDGNIFGCIDLKDGKRLWKRGRYGNGQVLLLPDAHQLLVISEQGELVLIEADPKELRELSKIQALDGKTWNHPVLIGNRLYLRNGKEAACFVLPMMKSADVVVEPSA